MDAQTSQIIKARLEGMRHDDKWEILKPELQILFATTEVPQIAELMKTKYGFDANHAAYKYRFKKWKWKKSIPAAQKDRALARIEERKVLGKRSAVFFEGREVDHQKLKRHKLNSTKVQRQSTERYSSTIAPPNIDVLGKYLPFGTRLFINWNMPFGVNRSPNLSPFPNPASSPAASPNGPLEIRSPSVVTPPTTGGPNAGNAPSPLTVAVARDGLATRFFQGDFNYLIGQLSKDQKMTMSAWMYDFWIFAFREAKNWGLQVRDTSQDFQSAHHSTAQDSPISDDNFRPLLSKASPYVSERNQVNQPSDLCRWSVHLPESSLYGDLDEAPETEENSIPRPPLNETLRQSLSNSSFTNIPLDQLPVAVPRMVDTASAPETALLEESLAFAIIAGNEHLVSQTLLQIKDQEHNLTNIFPLHIAVSYLNGGKTCCNILDKLLKSSHSFELRKQFEVNSHGHTLLDNLLLTILRSHSTTTMEMINSSLKGEPFAGIQVDICGRWDAESECIRTLAKHGRKDIPSNWKHKFCNTSIQAVCHCIVIIWENLWSSASGTLFEKLCTGCGLTLHPSSLHALVLTAFLLSSNSLPDEDLFGIIACLVTLFEYNEDPTAQAELSITQFSGQADTDGCDHSPYTPRSLAEELYVASGYGREWQESTRTGWQVLIEVLSLAEKGWKINNAEMDDEVVYSSVNEVLAFEPQELNVSYDYNCDCKFNNSHMMRSGPVRVFHENSPLGAIRAATQAEFLNYRRLNEGDRWTSNDFSMDEILSNLQAKGGLTLGYVNKDMMRKYCSCGQFDGLPISVREMVSKHYHSNMDLWRRTSFIPCPNTFTEAINYSVIDQTDFEDGI